MATAAATGSRSTTTSLVSCIEAPGLGHGPITRDPDVIKRAVAFVSEPVDEAETGGGHP